MNTANSQDILVEKLVSLSRIVLEHERTKETDQLIIEGLSIHSNSDGESILKLINKLDEQINMFNPQCQFCPHKCYDIDPFHMSDLWSSNEDIRNSKLLILSEIRKMAEAEYHDNIMDLFYKSLDVIGRRLDIDKLSEYVGKLKT